MTLRWTISVEIRHLTWVADDRRAFGSAGDKPTPLRARQTADLVAAGRAQALVDDSFAECDYGDWSGAALSELATEPAWETVQWLPSAAQFPQGETMAQMAHRATHGVQHLVRSHPDAVVWVVSHGDVIKAILADALGLHLDHFQRIVVDTASLSVVHAHRAGLSWNGSMTRERFA